jgi:glycerate kinase
MTRVLLAFDKFKDALTAQQAGEVVAAVLREAHPDWELDLAPLADGGEGFAGILTEAAGGRIVPCEVSGPRGGRVAAGFGLVSVAAIPAKARAQLGLQQESRLGAQIAVIEMAAASGLALLAAEQRDPWQTTSLAREN